MKFTSVSLLAISLLLVATRVPGAGGGTDPLHAEKERQDPVVEGIQAAVAKADWPRAQALAREGVAKNPVNPDYHNLYAYSIRMGANPEMELVFRHYNEALRLDPKHLGAHEYLGEAYLQVGNLAKAKEELRALDKLCFFSCKEFSTLKKAVADYEAKQPK